MTIDGNSSAPTLLANRSWKSRQRYKKRAFWRGVQSVQGPPGFGIGDIVVTPGRDVSRCNGDLDAFLEMSRQAREHVAHRPQQYAYVVAEKFGFRRKSELGGSRSKPPHSDEVEQVDVVSGPFLAICDVCTCTGPSHSGSNGVPPEIFSEFAYQDDEEAEEIDGITAYSASGSSGDLPVTTLGTGQAPPNIFDAMVDTAKMLGADEVFVQKEELTEMMMAGAGGFTLQEIGETILNWILLGGFVENDDNAVMLSANIGNMYD